MKSLVWYMGITLNLPWLHSYRCFDTFNFHFFCYFDIALVKWYSGIKSLCWSYAYFLTFITFNYADCVFWITAYVFIYSEFCFRVFKGIVFSFYNYITCSKSLFLALVISCVVFSPNVEEVSILLRFLCCLWFLMTFVLSSISLIFSFFLKF